jgi:CRP/FNR family transcriptional regulator, dissimilatory nitrate respiration regulator
MDLANIDSLPPGLRSTLTFQSLTTGQALYQQGDSAQTFFIVTSGRIKVVRYVDADKTTTLLTAHPGESLGEIALFADTYPAAAVAEVPSRVITYPKQALLSALRTYPDLSENLMARLVQRVQALKIRLEIRDVRASHERVLRYLQYVAESGDRTTIVIDRPFKEIAIDLGLTPETLSRALARLERDGRITRQQQQITLHHSAAA